MKDELSNIEKDIEIMLLSNQNDTFSGWNDYTDADGWEDWDHYWEAE